MRDFFAGLIILGIRGIFNDGMNVISHFFLFSFEVHGERLVGTIVWTGKCADSFIIGYERQRFACIGVGVE